MTKSRGERIRSSATVLWQIAHGVAKQTKSKRAIGPPKWVTMDDLGQNTHNTGDQRGAKRPPDPQVHTVTVVGRGCAVVHTHSLCGAGADTNCRASECICPEARSAQWHNTN